MNKFVRIYLPLLCNFVLAFSALQASAQLTTATLVGTVTDPTNAVIPHASVTIVNVETNFKAHSETNETGSYRSSLLPVGRYSVTIEAAGFQTFVQNNVVLQVNDQIRVDTKLSTGGTSQEITVNDQPPAINLENASVGRTLSTKDLEDLPILDRNIYNLLPLVPGVQAQTNGNTLGFPQQVVQINGSTTQDNSGNVTYYLDGGLNMTAIRMTGNQMPNPEALAEFNVQTSNYNAAYGRLSSGVVSAVTRSGTNRFHGAVYEFHRETNFNSNPFHGSRAPVHRNLFGGVLGGPILRDRTFFFLDYAGFRNVAPQSFTGTAVLPTALQARGNFSEFLPTSSGAITSCTQTLSAADKAAGRFVVCSPTTRKPYVGNIITDPLDTAAVNILKSLPAANAGSALAPTYVGSQGLPSNYNEYLGKVDHQLTTNQHLVASLFYLKGLNTIFPGTGSLPWGLQTQKYTLYVANLSDTQTISANKINQVWLTFTRSFGGRVNGPRKSLTDFGSSFAAQGPPSLPNVTVTNYFNLSNAIEGPIAGTNFYSLRDLFVWNKGAHNLQLGGEASLNKDQTQSLLNNYGTYTFTASTSANTGNALSDYLLGRLSRETQDAPVTSIDNSFFYAGFFQDDWRATNRLTLNGGLRYDVQTPPTDPQNKLSTFIPGRQSAVNPLLPLGQLVPGDAGITRGIVPIRFSHVSPRLGLAWDVFGTGRTSFRAGAGIFFGGVSGNEWNSPSGSYPFTLRYTFPVPGTLVNPYLNSPSPFPFSYTAGKVAAAPAGAALSTNSAAFQWPYTYQLNVSVQQELGHNLVLGIAYVGALGRKLPFNRDANYPVFNATTPTANTTGNINSRRPFGAGGLGTIISQESSATSNYNALQVTFSQPLTHSIRFNGYYAFTKTINSYNFDSTAAAQDYSNLKSEKALAGPDQRHLFVTTVVWEPNYIHNNRYLSAALNHWKVTPIVKMYSGTPFNVTTGTDANLDGNTTDRPNQIGNPYSASINHKSRAAELFRYFDPAAFCAYSVVNPTACPGTGPGGSNGTVHRNSLTGPGSKTVDVAIIRDFPLREALTFELRGESTNVLNFVNPNNPSGTINISASANQITTGQPMRTIQVGGRLFF